MSIPSRRIVAMATDCDRFGLRLGKYWARSVERIEYAQYDKDIVVEEVGDYLIGLLRRDWLDFGGVLKVLAQRWPLTSAVSFSFFPPMASEAMHDLFPQDSRAAQIIARELNGGHVSRFDDVLRTFANGVVEFLATQLAIQPAWQGHRVQTCVDEAKCDIVETLYRRVAAIASNGRVPRRKKLVISNSASLDIPVVATP